MSHAADSSQLVQGSAGLIRQLLDECGHGPQAQDLLSRARELPLWLRRHGLAITWRKLEALRKAAPDDPVIARMIAALMLPRSGLPLALEEIVERRRDPEGQAAYVLASHEARRRADAFALAARLLIQDAR